MRTYIKKSEIAAGKYYFTKIKSRLWVVKVNKIRVHTLVGKVFFSYNVFIPALNKTKTILSTDIIFYNIVDNKAIK